MKTKIIDCTLAAFTLFACAADDSVKLLARRDRLYETAWQPGRDVALELRGATLDEIWSSLCSQVIFGDASPVDIQGRIERRNRTEALRNELSSHRYGREHGRFRFYPYRRHSYEDDKQDSPCAFYFRNKL